MMRRRIFLWMGLSVLFASLCLSREGLAHETYQVRPGDTLYRISEKTGITIKDLKRANRLHGTRLKPDQILVIPTSEEKRSAKSVKSSSPSGKESIELLQGHEEEDDGIAGEAAMAVLDRHTKESRSLLGSWSTPDEQQLLVKAAMGFLGAPYRLGGFSMKGLDCSGLVKKIYQTFNIDLPRTAFEQSHVGLRVARSKLIEGDLLFFNTRRTLGHVGIYIGNNQFVHASSRKRGVRIDNLNTPYFDKRFARAVRLKGNDDNM
ncbi:MAG: hypothetical protein A3J94_00025 [Syntrophus sp. RIFOXYC2_FULL_54_9]|nr:MAG: hypothetical protein A3J94_00025 [Syntrophus sp. RIFOXYC2_FULL_54_9]